MASKRRTKTPTIAQLYREERRKAERRIKNIEKRGYYFAETPLKEPPKKPTRKSIEALQKLTPSKLYQIAEYRTPSGEILTGTQGRSYERTIAAQKGAETRIYKRTGEISSSVQRKHKELSKYLIWQPSKTQEQKYRIHAQARDLLYEEQDYSYSYEPTESTIYDTETYKYKTLSDVAYELSEAYDIPLSEAYDYAIYMPDTVDLHEWYAENSKQAKIRQLQEQAGKDVDEVLEKRDEAYKDIAKQNLTSWESRSLIDDITYNASNEIDAIYEKLNRDIQKINEAQVKDVVRDTVDIELPKPQTITPPIDNITTEENIPDYTYTDTSYYPEESDVILTYIEELINNWSPDPKWSKTGVATAQDNMSHLKSILNRAIAKEGRDKVAQRIEDNADEVNGIVEVIAYQSYRGTAQAELSRIADILNGSALDAMESAEFSDLQDEYYDDEYEI